jgi:hypothetical protein
LPACAAGSKGADDFLGIPKGIFMNPSPGAADHRPRVCHGDGGHPSTRVACSARNHRPCARA